jgi:hypothetical protein
MAAASVSLKPRRQIATAYLSKRPDPPRKRRAGTCHNAPAEARHDRSDFYQKTDRLAAWFGAFINQENKPCLL